MDLDDLEVSDDGDCIFQRHGYWIIMFMVMLARSKVNSPCQIVVEQVYTVDRISWGEPENVVKSIP